METQIEIIDTHTFLGTNNEWGIRNSEKYFKLSRFKNIKFLTIPFSPTKNKQIIKKVKKDKKFLGCYLIFNPNKEDTKSKGLDWNKYSSPEVIDKLLSKKYVIGLKTFPSLYKTEITDKAFFPYYEIAIKHDVPILIHCSSSAKEYENIKMIEEVIKKFPRLKFILAHFGGLKEKYMKEAVKLAEKYKNIYLNTTALCPWRIKRQVCIEGGKRTEIRMNDDWRISWKIFRDATKTIPEQILLGSDLGYYYPDEYSLWPIELLKSENPQLAKTISIDNPKRLFKKMKKF